jgi:hypothetical protein
MIFVVLLLVAILITLLGGWLFFGFWMLILVGVISAFVLFSFNLSDVSQSGIGDYFRNTARIKELNRLMKTKSTLGYETDEYESEVIYLKNKMFQRNNFKT